MRIPGGDFFPPSPPKLEGIQKNNWKKIIIVLYKKHLQSYATILKNVSHEDCNAAVDFVSQIMCF